MILVRNAVCGQAWDESKKGLTFSLKTQLKLNNLICDNRVVTK